MDYAYKCMYSVSIHAPVMGANNLPPSSLKVHAVSIHAPVMGAKRKYNLP